MKNASLKMVAAVLAVLGIGLMIVNFGTAHPLLLDEAPETTPHPGEMLEVSPDVIQLTFNEDTVHGGMEPELSRFYVVQLPGSNVALMGGADLDDPARSSMKATLDEPLADGEYLVRWVAVSAADSGYTEGAFNFFVGGNPDGIGTRNEGGTAVGGPGGEGHGHGDEEDGGNN